MQCLIHEYIYMFTSEIVNEEEEELEASLEFIDDGSRIVADVLGKAVTIMSKSDVSLDDSW